jgi:hypothetical protein
MAKKPTPTGKKPVTKSDKENDADDLVHLAKEEEQAELGNADADDFVHQQPLSSSKEKDMEDPDDRVHPPAFRDDEQ